VLRRLLAPVAVAGLLGVGLGGCADGKVREANDYVGAVNAAQSRFAATSEKLLRDIAPDDRRAHNRAALGRFYGAVDGFVTALRRIDPPARVRALHARMIAAIVRFGADLRAAGAAITSGRASRILGGQERLARATSSVARRINSTIGEINAALRD
jgi:hypothetical protein